MCFYLVFRQASGKDEVQNVGLVHPHPGTGLPAFLHRIGGAQMDPSYSEKVLRVEFVSQPLCPEQSYKASGVFLGASG